MSLENTYLEALELTHQMLARATAQDWDSVTRIGNQRALLVEKAANSGGALTAHESKQISETIAEIERESAEIVERVQCWQEHVKVLLRMKKPSS